MIDRIKGAWAVLTGRAIACVVSGFPAGVGEPGQPGQTFQFYEDNWPHGVPRENQGREHGA